MNLVIFGSGAMARLLHSYLISGERPASVVGFTVDDNFCNAQTFCGLPLVPWSEAPARFEPKYHAIIMAIGFMDMNRLRMDRIIESRAVGYQQAQCTEKNVRRHEDIMIGGNTIIYDHTSIHTGSKIGDGVFISSNVNVGHDCVIEDGAWINSGICLGGGVTVGECSFLGIGATIAEGVKLGPRTYVGANTLVTSDTAADAVIVSEPGTVINIDSGRFLKLLEAK